MTIKEVREHREYTKAIQKIENYPSGFEFTIYYSSIPVSKCNALKVVLRDAQEQGLIESIAIGLSIDLVEVEETFRRI